MGDFFNKDFLERQVEERKALAPDDEIRKAAIEFNSKKRRANVGMTSSCYDQDNSGTYNPRGDRLTPLPPKAKRLRVDRSPNDDDSQKSKRAPIGYSFPMSFVFEGEAGKALLKSITPGPYEKPDSNSDDDESSDSSDEDSSLPRRKTKPRRKLAAAPMQRSDGRKIEDLTEGHPQRRGCKSCFLGSDDCCTLIDDPLAWPCVACEDAGSECEFIIPPKLKMACANCKKQKIQCSYTKNGGKGVAKCDDCEDYDLTCLAAPLDEDSNYGRRFAHIKTPPPPSDIYEHERMYVLCQQCRNSQPKVRCSLRSKSDKGPCRHCKASNQECEFLEPDMEMRAKIEKKAQEKKAVAKAERKAAKQAAKATGKKKGKEQTKDPKVTRTNMESKAPVSEGGARRNSYQLLSSPCLSTSTNGIPHKIISTSFAHPIKFNHVVPDNDSDPCRFCDDPFFGLWGDGIKQVEVIPYGGRKGYVEVSGGHFSEQGNNTKMCFNCTYDRVRITSCHPHRVVPLQGVNPLSYNPKALLNSLNALNAEDGRKEEGNLAINTKWCSICTSVAEFHCTAPHKYSSRRILKNPTQVLANTVDPEFIGCGLYLCGVCNHTLRRIETSKPSTDKRNTTDIVVKLRESELNQHPRDEMRADSELLHSGGLMVTFLNASAKGGVKERPKPLLEGRSTVAAQEREKEKHTLTDNPMERPMEEPIEKRAEGPKEKSKDIISGFTNGYAT